MKNIIFLIGFLCGVNSFAQEIEIELFVSGVPNPVSIKHAGDSRLFIVDLRGLIYIINEDGKVNDAPFLDIKDRVSDAQDERGLLGLAFHPNYTSNGYFYVNYVNGNLETIISRFTSSTADPSMADPNSELILMIIPQPYSNHNGGELVFNADGLLYIALGDGGGDGDPDKKAQNLNSFLGKILRIDVDKPEDGKNYGIPDTNPYVGNPDALDEIWAYGLRNPWKFSIDHVTNELWIADVGQSNSEEINNVSATEGGLNYGWPCYEGNEFYTDIECSDVDALTYPITGYSHINSGVPKCSITGGYRYRGVAQPNFTGIYFFADFCSSEIGMLTEKEGVWTMAFSEAFQGNNWTTFGEDNKGELYIGAINSGSIYKIKDPNLHIAQSDLPDMKLYPNPAGAELIIDFGSKNNPISKLHIYNIQGQQIKTLVTFESHLSKISTENLAKGMYLMEIYNADGQKTTRKFVKN
ncbi:putative secreted protein (Por secretion system target) [Gelidibacter algens]|jgi:hypothetical protein|uniref:Putative secreted protein (Por secretion system target) n=1 Tax=Gelidibacter algens TaxID=49280 RepID=A0A1A7R405_9FLAO|nr:PQQ-dependent sugar dehydrogenase [Gelidibacter algens]OBX26243.1 hypothetical protein A9996_05560 [Gelidibacter algens]RAJ24876.1 putative secreted protein (Por secretion system target) [Gelidibacter algens]